jgi:hypothetical protein
MLLASLQKFKISLCAVQPNRFIERTKSGVPAFAAHVERKGFPIFVKQKSLVVESRSD